MAVKVRHKNNGGEREFNDFIWDGMNKDLKNQWEVITDFTDKTKVQFTPPELTQPVVTKHEADKKTETPAGDLNPTEGVPGNSNLNIETPEEKIIRLNAEGKSNGEIAKEVGGDYSHHTQVASFLKTQGK